jgi:hypothetical protein
MDPARGKKKNSELFIHLRACAAKSFEAERVCNLHSFEDDSIEDCETILAKEDGLLAGKIRDHYYHQVLSTICFPDLQSYFLFAFTMGINKFSSILLDPEDLSKDVPPIGKEVLARHFPIPGPQWLTEAANAEMPYVENVFCDFQNEILIPTGLQNPGDGRILADVFAGSLLWAYFGGSYWFSEAIAQITEASRFACSPRQMEGMHEVKRRMLFLDEEDCAKALAAQNLFDEDSGEEILCSYCDGGEGQMQEQEVAVDRKEMKKKAPEPEPDKDYNIPRKDMKAPKGKFRVIGWDDFPVPPEHSYSPHDVLRYETEPPEVFVPHPLFSDF